MTGTKTTHKVVHIYMGIEEGRLSFYQRIAPRPTEEDPQSIAVTQCVLS